MKLVLRRAAARDDAHAIAANRRDSKGAASAGRFVAAYRKALGLIAEEPSKGSSCWAYELEIPGLMTWVLRGFGCSLVYIDKGDHLELWRVLGHSQIPQLFRNPADDPEGESG